MNENEPDHNIPERYFMRLKNKVVLITASNRGIGLAAVEACAEEGAIVYMAARNLQRAKAEEERLAKKGYRIRSVYFDATEKETYRSMIKEVVERSGRIDVLINNFGTSDPEDLDFIHTRPEVFSRIVRLNLESVFIACQEAAPYMIAQGGGSIVNISSVGGIVPDVSQIAYPASKGAINYLTRLIAAQGAKYRIRCNAVLPGMTDTEAVKQHLSDEFREQYLHHTPFKRMATVEEIARAILYFASDESSYTTGQMLVVSGGFGSVTPLYCDIENNKK